MIRSGLIGIAVIFAVFFGAGPAAPQAPQGTGAPFVKSVGFYQDWQLTQPIDTSVEPGTTLYTKIVFSEPMKLNVADDSSARPVLYYRVGEERIRYRIARHGAGGADFVSGDAKPLQNGTDDYICKYTIPEDATGEFRTMVGKLSADTSGNTMERFYTHSVRLTISRDVTPAVAAVGGDPNLPQQSDPTMVASTDGAKDNDPNLSQPTNTPVDPETLIDMLDTTDILTVADTAPGQEPRDDAFIFKKFLEQVLADLKAAVPSFDYDVETIFQTPGKGFQVPNLGPYGFRPAGLRVQGLFIPDAVTAVSLQQINKFSAEYNLTKEELTTLLRNLSRAVILVVDPLFHVVNIPDENLREAVVAAINDQGISLVPINSPKMPTDPIYAGEMRKIFAINGGNAGIKSLIGLEHAINLVILNLSNGPMGERRYSMRKGEFRYLEYQLFNDPIRKENLEWARDNGYQQYEVPSTQNSISDLTPLQNLTRLNSLELHSNAVSNLNPLRNLRNLNVLDLTANKITNIDALADLTNLVQLVIDNNAIKDIRRLRNLTNLEVLYASRNPIGSSIDVVRNFPKLFHLHIRCCGVSNLRPLVECQGLSGPRSLVLLDYNPLTNRNIPDIIELVDRGVHLQLGADYIWEDDNGTNRTSLHGILDSGSDQIRILKNEVGILQNNVARCSDPRSYLIFVREVVRDFSVGAPLRTELDVLSSVWHDLSQVPEETSLLPNYPNPFNPETWIPYQLATPAEVTVAIHAADGRLVRTLALGYQAAGVYKSKGRAAYWDGRNAQGEPVASGVYFYTLMTGDFTATRKLLIRK